MSLQTEREMIETHLREGWFDELNQTQRTKIQWEDIPIEPSNNEVWLAVSILNGQASNKSVGSPGSNIVRSAGVFAIRVNVPSGLGSSQFRDHADDLMDLFRNTVLGNVRFMPPYVSGGLTKMGNFSTWTIMCPFTRDEFNG